MLVRADDDLRRRTLMFGSRCHVTAIRARRQPPRLQVTAEWPPARSRGWERLGAWRPIVPRPRVLSPHADLEIKAAEQQR